MLADIQNFALRAHCVHGIPYNAICTLWLSSKIGQAKSMFQTTGMTLYIFRPHKKKSSMGGVLQAAAMSSPCWAYCSNILSHGPNFGHENLMQLNVRN